MIWNYNYGGTGADYFMGVTLVSDGYIASGYSPSTDVDLLGLNKGSTDSIIVKYDFSGNLVWKRNHGGTGADYFYGIKYFNNDIIVVGNSSSTNVDHLSLNLGDLDATIFRINNTYSKIWNRNYGGGPGLDYLFQAAYLNNNILTVGYSNSNILDFSNNKGNYDGIAINYDMEEQV